MTKPTMRNGAAGGGAAMNRLMAAWATWIRDWETASRQTPAVRQRPEKQDYDFNAYIDGFLDGINAGVNSR